MICTIDDCGARTVGRGWCSKHYQRWLHHGDPTVRLTHESTGFCLKCGLPTEARNLCHRHYQRWKYQQNPQVFCERERQRRLEHPSLVRAQERARHAANPGPKRTANKNRRLRLAGVPGHHTHAQWVKLLEQFAGRCAYCGDKATTKDHVVPLAAGGANAIWNILPACLRCNTRKGTRSLEDWLAIRAA